MKANKIIIVPTTHWDREWYLTFNEFRAKLVNMMDKLLNILKNDPSFKNFTLDGQIIPLEDYLEVKPENKELIEKFVKEGKLSIGPMYVLPDEFLVSGESIIRNILLGHIFGRRFGKVMKAGYIPDTFGHIAQLPQILQGCEIPSMLFMRGFGNEFEENNLNMEFTWNAPGESASILTIHLVYGYYSAAELNTTLTNGKYQKALKQLKKAIKRLENHTATDIILLNNGSDHLFAQPEVPEILKQWNNVNPDLNMEINDFEYYISKVLSVNPPLKNFEGELRGGKYHPLLSGVFSARMWIKQKNTEIENLYEKYAEPLSTIAWALDKYNKFSYPNEFLWTGLKWLIKNHPHDSICGCSIDEVHEEMKTRFQWSEQIANEITKNSSLFLSDLIKLNTNDKEKTPILIYNPLPWERKDITYLDVIFLANKDPNEIQSDLVIIDNEGNNIGYQLYKIKEKPRYRLEPSVTYRITFIAKIPACGYKVYYVAQSNPNETLKPTKELDINNKSIENEYYKVAIKNDSQLDLLDKESGTLYENILQFEDVGDWGDEYDFSGPKKGGIDKKYTLQDASQVKTKLKIDGPSQKTLKLSMILNLPISLSKDRTKREENLAPNKISVYITLYKEINRIDFKIKINNQSQDHRIRVIFSSKVKSERIFADGHFYVIPRDIKLPNSDSWAQTILPTNHQKDFVCAQDDATCFAVFNKGLPEYEAIIDKNETIKLAITLLRCVGWLSRVDLATRMGRSALAGPPFHTPGAQCLGKYEFDLSLCIKNDKVDFLDAQIPIIGKEFSIPLVTIIPSSIKSILRVSDKLLSSLSFVSQLYKNLGSKEFEPYLPECLSFLEIDNKNVLISALKKSEIGNSLIARIYNLASNSEKVTLKFFQGITIKHAKLVNLLEEEPKNVIKASLTEINENHIKLEIESHVVATIKIDL